MDVIIIFQETGEKLRELRNQIEQKNEELSFLEAENKQLKQDINNQPKVSFDTCNYSYMWLSVYYLRFL